MNALGRPLRPMPDDFEEVFVAIGWDSVDHYSTNPKRVARWLDDAGRDKLKQRRRNYVIGNRLSSLKRGRAKV